jgi:dTDP-glucose 4,6-dehydratase
MNNLLITGGCGFIGANFIRYLLEETDFAGRLINIDKLTYAGNPESLQDLAEKEGDRYVFRHADICDAEIVGSILDEYEIDTVCHFAAESHVDRSIYEPGAFIQTNIIGTHNLLEKCRERQDRIGLFHHISTDEVFGSLGPEGQFTETSPYQPNSPYSASKASSDHLVRAYHHTYGLPVTISNCSNNYGPYQFPEKLIPLMILNAMEGQPLPVYGDGKHVRDWLYVRDHCTAIWQIMNRGRHGDTYNVGGKTEMENIRIVEAIIDAIDGAGRDLITFVKDRPGHDRRYAVDCSKLERELGWAPEESFETGLKRTVNWYAENREWVDRVRSGAYQNWVEKHYG